ncbi:hypothetical protein DCAR_0207313 [Daucus carota subsp. sativus]|uniref:Uncharacterized protein n=1 Tax=Daucus carota subsp. sativus TaxID=79200 RepID=A0A166DTC4_DAUCS|nr:PREDICTED: uncharacterized protein LOC108206813 [Daucus carota subsp. sativus]WOG88080.1 hypothetical protein DCAR_0207313 [Daucus carota subsp. sativus]
MKRVPRIKFPQRHPKPSDAASQNKAKPVAGSGPQTFFSGSNKPANTGGGMASLQPKRTPLSQDEIDSILLGGCI